MKKFISMVMAAAMVVSLVPATAFAATGTVESKGTAKVLDAVDEVEDFGKVLTGTLPKVSIKLDEADAAGTTIKQEIKFKLDGAKFYDASGSEYPTADATPGALVEDMQEGTGNAAETYLLGLLTAPAGLINKVVKVEKYSNTSVTFSVSAPKTEWQTAAAANQTFEFALETKLNKDNAGAVAKVSVTTDIEGADKADMVFATVEGKGVDVELNDEVKDVAPEEIITIDDIDVEPAVGADFGDVMKDTAVVKLKLSKGFEFKYDASAKAQIIAAEGAYTGNLESDVYVEDDVIEIAWNAVANTWTGVTFKGLKVEATDAKAGDEATLTVKFGDNESAKLVVAKVIESGLTISVDEDEDVPVMWSGVDYQNTGLTADNDEHVALEVTIEETFVGSYNDKDEIELTLPDGVYVVGFNPTTEDVTATAGNMTKAFEAAYQEGEYKSFIFEKRAFVETTTDEIEMAFELTLVADPGFVGEVPMTMKVDGEEVGTVVIAKFESPMFIEAQQNDLKIDYRNTAVGSDIVIKEAEAGLWAKNTEVKLEVEKMTFEDDATFTVNEDESDMEIKDTTKGGVLGFKVTKVSDDEAAVITISDMELYMGRSLAAGAYDLTMVGNTCVEKYLGDVLFAAKTTHKTGCALEVAGVAYTHDCGEEFYVNDVTDYSDVVKEGFVNIVTAGREQDDASFTTKVVVPVGESYIIAGEQTVALDVPAYVSEAGYTMLPVRAVATALGINNNNVLWDQATKTVTILYGQRIITMTVGAKVINVNGSAIPASASVEVVDGRTFLPMRDLATALGVTDITWDAATKTATLNGNV